MPDDRDRPVVGEAELAGDLVEQVLDVVADAPGAVGAEVREVLADLGRVDAGQLGQALRGDRRRSPARRSRAAPGSRAAGGRRSPPGSGARRESEPPRRPARGRGRGPRPASVPTLCMFSQSVRVIRSTAWSSASPSSPPSVSSLFAQAMLVRYTAGHQPQHRAWTIALALFALASAALATGIVDRLGQRHLPGLLPPRRGGQRAVAGPRHRVPPGAGSGRPGGCCGGSCCSPASPPACSLSAPMETVHGTAIPVGQGRVRRAAAHPGRRRQRRRRDR